MHLHGTPFLGPASITSLEASPPSPSPHSPPPPLAPPAHPAALERPEFRDRPKPLAKSIASVTSMMVEYTANGDIVGLTSDIIATVPAESRRGAKAGIGFYRADGDDTMKTALQ